MKRTLSLVLLIAGLAITLYGLFFTIMAYLRVARPNDTEASLAGIGIVFGILLIIVGTVTLLIANRLRKQ